MKKKLAIIMPVYNEEAYIDDCIKSLMNQIFPKKDMQIFFVDGGSTDKTIDIINKYVSKYPGLIYLLNNPNKTAPFAMNIGIENSESEYIIRLDAHAEYPDDYIEKCIYYLEKTDAHNVGGLAKTKGKGHLGKIIAKLLSSKFGVGNSQFRTEGKSGYVDTVPFGAFPRKIFNEIGLYDTRLTRNQDNELNYRIRKNGGKIYLSKGISFTYYCRNTLTGLLNMGKNNGKWNVITMKLVPGSMGVRHFIPFVFLLSLILMPILSVFSTKLLYIFVVELALYFFLDIVFSIKEAENLKEFFVLLGMYPLFHISYGFGSLIGIFNLHKFK